MADEKEGPYKIVSKLVNSREAPYYSIVVQLGNDAFQRELVPNAGTAATARELCNLLNREWRAAQEASEALTRKILDLGGNHDSTD